MITDTPSGPPKNGDTRELKDGSKQVFRYGSWFPLAKAEEQKKWVNK